MASRCDRRAVASETAASTTGLTDRSVGIWTRIFLNMVVLPSIREETRQPRSGIAEGPLNLFACARLPDGSAAKVDAHQTRRKRARACGGAVASKALTPKPVESRATSARAGLLEAAIGCDRSLKQLFLLPSIARRPMIALLAVFRRRRYGAQAAEALQIAKVSQHALQSLCRP